ncbi:GspH/FimT family pseudopilin [Deinococcus pimensis]|uniref:GspH/FimT family pseudopilin n=1 Tax=Deinococcus pimensis TaxID=309888 RepID=UPI0004847CFF|nr:GspH/FimT family pseudopilin [Deinococcus pimensis]
MTRSRFGFTIIELLVVIAATGVFAALLGSTMRPDRTAVNQAANGMAAMVARARLEALRTNQPMGVRIDPAIQRAFVFVDRNLDLAFGAGDEPLASTAVTYAQGDYRAVRLKATAATTLVFDARGVLRTLNGTSSVQLTSVTDAATLRTVTVSAQGRSAVE